MTRWDRCLYGRRFCTPLMALFLDNVIKFANSIFELDCNLFKNALFRRIDNAGRLTLPLREDLADDKAEGPCDGDSPCISRDQQI